VSKEENLESHNKEKGENSAGVIAARSLSGEMVRIAIFGYNGSEILAGEPETGSFAFIATATSKYPKAGKSSSYSEGTAVSDKTSCKGKVEVRGDNGGAELAKRVATKEVGKGAPGCGGAFTEPPLTVACLHR